MSIFERFFGLNSYNKNKPKTPIQSPPEINQPKLDTPPDSKFVEPKLKPKIKTLKEANQAMEKIEISLAKNKHPDQKTILAMVSEVESLLEDSTQGQESNKPSQLHERAAQILIALKQYDKAVKALSVPILKSALAYEESLASHLPEESIKNECFNNLDKIDNMATEGKIIGPQTSDTVDIRNRIEKLEKLIMSRLDESAIVGKEIFSGGVTSASFAFRMLEKAEKQDGNAVMFMEKIEKVNTLLKQHSESKSEENLRNLAESIFLASKALCEIINSDPDITEESSFWIKSELREKIQEMAGSELMITEVYKGDRFDLNTMIIRSEGQSRLYVAKPLSWIIFGPKKGGENLVVWHHGEITTV